MPAFVARSPSLQPCIAQPVSRATSFAVMNTTRGGMSARWGTGLRAYSGGKRHVRLVVASNLFGDVPTDIATALHGGKASV